MTFPKQTWQLAAVIAGLAFCAMLPSFLFGVTSGNDMFQHYQFAATIRDSITSGAIYPGFSGNINQGFGDVGLRFYPPAGYYLLTLFFLVTRDWYVASLITFFTVFFIGGIGVYLWSREAFSPEQSIVAAGIYIFAPFHLNEIYNNFLFAEFVASAVIPFCFLFATRVCRSATTSDVIGLGVSYALLILSHLPVTVIGSLALLIYSLLLLNREQVLSQIARLGSGVGLALLLSAFYWTRMATELSWVKHAGEHYSAGIWGYRSNFLFEPSHILDFQNDFRSLWLADLMLLAIIAISLPTIVVLVRRKQLFDPMTRAISIVLILVMVMTTPLTGMIWDNLGLLQRVQFPWRFMSMISVFGAIFASTGVASLLFKLSKPPAAFSQIGYASCLFVFVFTAAFVIRGAVYHPHDEFNAEVAKSADGVSFDGWWPIWARQEAFKDPESVDVKDRSVVVNEWEPETRRFTVEAGPAQNVRVAVFYYPYWKAEVNGEPVTVDKDINGAVLLPIPGSRSDVDLHFENPYLIRAAVFLSMATLMGIIIAFFWSVKNRQKAFLSTIYSSGITP